MAKKKNPAYHWRHGYPYASRADVTLTGESLRQLAVRYGVEDFEEIPEEAIIEAARAGDPGLAPFFDFDDVEGAAMFHWRKIAQDLRTAVQIEYVCEGVSRPVPLTLRVKFKDQPPIHVPTRQVMVKKPLREQQFQNGVRDFVSFARRYLGLFGYSGLTRMINQGIKRLKAEDSNPEAM